MPDQYAFPMAPAGGVFIAVMGICVAMGGVIVVLRKPLLVAGAVLATAALFTVGPHLQTGRPTSLQLWFLFGSIALECVLVRAAIQRCRDQGERRAMLAVLLAIGVHFIPMAVAFGPLCLALALVCISNALAGTYFFQRASLDRLWAIDGLIKVALGLCMVATAPSVHHGLSAATAPHHSTAPSGCHLVFAYSCSSRPRATKDASRRLRPDLWRRPASALSSPSESTDSKRLARLAATGRPLPIQRLSSWQATQPRGDDSSDWLPKADPTYEVGYIEPQTGLNLAIKDIPLRRLAC